MDFTKYLDICSKVDIYGVVFLDWTYSLATVSPQRTTVTLRLAYTRLQPASSFYQKILLLGYKSTVFQVKVMTLSTDTVSESDPKQYLNTTLRSETTDTSLKLYFDSVVPPKTVMRLQIDTFAATGTSLTLLADTKETASLVNKS